VEKEKEQEMTRKSGFTLIEVLIATAVLAGVTLAILSTFMQCSNLRETSKNLGIAMSAARAEIEQLHNQDFSSIATGTFTFDPIGLNGKGQTIITNASLTAIAGGGTTADLKNIRVVVCWQQRSGRTIGEDNGAGQGTALDGILHNDEDADGDGEIDSPATVVASIANK